ncbi:hypothetical protein L484_006213 [Morus notabilis]|uniref:DUF1308 domain-containing protein n=1 Tax=Morus notabilis TaxID=981085 RepID=W9QIU1_9ROSA|nr:hypothetical protein L484_006213 [Morus notabilis]
MELAKKRCRAVIERIEKLPTSPNKLTASCQRTLFKLADSELRFLSHFSSSTLTSLRSRNSEVAKSVWDKCFPGRIASEESLITHQFTNVVNIGHIEAVVHILQQPFITGVSRVCKPIPFSSRSRRGQKSILSKDVHVDIVCILDRNPVWIIVSDRNPKYVSWNESHKSKGLKLRIEQALAAARTSVALKPSSIILFFSNGLKSEIYEKLKDEFGAVELGLEFSVFNFDFSEDLEGDWISVLSRTYREACVLEIKVNETRDAASTVECVKDSLREAARVGLSKGHMEKDVGNSFSSLISRMAFFSMEEKSADNTNPAIPLGEGDFVNFDTTALIALVSGISNGASEKLLATPEAELRQRFKGNYEFVIGQRRLNSFQDTLQSFETLVDPVPKLQEDVATMGVRLGEVQGVVAAMGAKVDRIQGAIHRLEELMIRQARPQRSPPRRLREDYLPPGGIQDDQTPPRREHGRSAVQIQVLQGEIKCGEGKATTAIDLQKDLAREPNTEVRNLNFRYFMGMIHTGGSFEPNGTSPSTNEKR